MNTQMLEILTRLDVRSVSLESKVDITNLELTDLKSKVLVINEDPKKKSRYNDGERSIGKKYLYFRRNWKLYRQKYLKYMIIK